MGIEINEEILDKINNEIPKLTGERLRRYNAFVEKHNKIGKDLNIVGLVDYLVILNDTDLMITLDKIINITFIMKYKDIDIISQKIKLLNECMNKTKNAFDKEINKVA